MNIKDLEFLANELNNLLGDEDLNSTKLAEACEGLLPNIADYLNYQLNACDGVSLIAEERREQLEKHGRKIAYDMAENSGRELACAATALIFCGFGDYDYFPTLWEQAIVNRMWTKDYKGRLITAGALIAAEIDRIS